MRPVAVSVPHFKRKTPNEQEHDPRAPDVGGRRERHVPRLGRDPLRAGPLRATRVHEARPPKVRDAPPQVAPLAPHQQVAGVQVLVDESPGVRRREAYERLVHHLQRKAGVRLVVEARVGLPRGPVQELLQGAVHPLVRRDAGGHAVKHAAVEARRRGHHVRAGHVQQAREELVREVNRHAFGGPLQDHGPLRPRVRGRVDGQHDTPRQPRPVDEARLVEGLAAKRVKRRALLKARPGPHLRHDVAPP